jgi:hypothetical protein
LFLPGISLQRAYLFVLKRNTPKLHLHDRRPAIGKIASFIPIN